MSTGFDRAAWDRLATLFDASPATIGGHSNGTPSYAGYKPEVREAPNGDTKVCPRGCVQGMRFPEGAPGRTCETCNGTGRVPNVDAGPAGKRYLHVAEKYLAQHPGLEWPRQYLARAYYEIARVADALRVPDAYYPRPEDTTLRVLEYPSAAHRHVPESPFFCDDCHRQTNDTDAACTALDDGVCPKRAEGAGTAEHTDPDLFTIVCWRETPEDLIHVNGHEPAKFTADAWRRFSDADYLSPDLHIGQIGELVGLGPATPHRVPARPYVQRSIVAFAMPRLDARLPWRESVHASVNDVPTVREWIDAWKKRGRVYA